MHISSTRYVQGYLATYVRNPEPSTRVEHLESTNAVPIRKLTAPHSRLSCYVPPLRTWSYNEELTKQQYHAVNCKLIKSRAELSRDLMMWISVRSMGTQDAGGIPNFLTLPEVAESLDMTLTNTSRRLDRICNKSMPSNLFPGTLDL